MLSLLLDPSILAMSALVLAVLWMLRDQTDKTRPLLVMALVVNFFYGWLLNKLMGQEDSLVPWKYDYLLLHVDAALGLRAAPIAAVLQGRARVPLELNYRLMVPAMIVWFAVVKQRELQRALALAYVAEITVGPALYALVPACGPIYAFGAAWLHPPVVTVSVIRLAGMPNAFPSLHVGTALILVLLSRHRIPRAIALFFLGGTILATLATGEHYVIDLVAGLAFGCFATAAGRLNWRRAAFYGGLTLSWSLSMRFASQFWLAWPLALRGFAALTVLAAVAALGMEWRANDDLEERVNAASATEVVVVVA